MTTTNKLLAAADLNLQVKRFVALLTSLSLLGSTILMTGCASSVANPVPVAQVGDETKSCDAIANEKQTMVTAQVEADSNKDKQIGTNAALGVTGIFLLGIPWFFMDLGGANTAEQKAAKARFDRLEQMQVDKKCPATPIVMEQKVEGGQNIVVTETAVSTTGSANITQKLEDLNMMLKKGLITQKDYDTKKSEILKSL
jgi:hypothetical protein